MGARAPAPRGDSGRVLRLRFKKVLDGRPSLACHRPDGTVAVQRQPEAFPVHDFTHYAVETVLGLRHAFYGLMADGWDFDDFGNPWPSGPLPVEAAWAEHVVGIFWREVGAGFSLPDKTPLDEINWAVAQASEVVGFRDRHLTAQEVDAIRQTQQDLIARWRSLPKGETLELGFPAPEVA